MNKLLLGRDRETGLPVHVPRSSFNTHWHIIGGTGKGKTTAITTLLHALLLDPSHRDCFVIIDRLGGFSSQLLLWMASPFCTQRVRDRLVYFEAAREDVVLPFNPLLYETPAHGHYKVSRATEVILRGWESQNIEAMPRLARWIFNAFWAAAQLGLTISDCVHLLMPGSPLHESLIRCLPDRLRYEWQELMDARNSEVGRMLESARNRLKPYFENDILRRMFGGTANRLDVLRFMREGKILLVNLAPQNRVAPQVADAIGGLIINEVLATARSLPGAIRYPTFLWLDEFQRFVGPDLEEAIPEVRQLGLRLVLAHQSFTQLRRGDLDMTSLIFQAQSRMVFGVQGEDAEILAHEFGSLSYDPKRVKEELYSRRQLHRGHRIVELTSGSESQAVSRQSGHTEGTGEQLGEAKARTGSAFDRHTRDTRTESNNRSRNQSRQESSGTTRTSSTGYHQTLVPEYEEFLELSTRSSYTFDEQKALWAQKIRQLRTGTELMRLVDDPRLYEVQVKRSAPGYLGLDMETLHRHFPQALEAVDRLLERNFQADCFCSPAEIDLETNMRLEQVLQRPQPAVEMPTVVTAADPFIR